MNEQLLLANIRGVLIRLEETIIFALIERAQFLRNPQVYQPGVYSSATDGESILEYLLHETERIHAKMRRYTSPDEHPFFNDLPLPALPELGYAENPLRENAVNINDRIRRVYESEIIPSLSGEGDDFQYGSTAVCDVACLQALSKRIHYGKFVAESKLRETPEIFTDALETADRSQIRKLITNEAVEHDVLTRVRRKADTYSRELIESNACGCRVPAAVIESVYRDFVIPMTKDVEVEYLLNP
jgi:chorismate mutase